jgi:anti-sigma factor RsiW
MANDASERSGPVSERAGGLTHEQAWELLPWLVNETLLPHERHGVEAHLAACPICRAEAERCRALGAGVRGAEVAPSPHPAQLARLLRRIDEVEGERRRPLFVRLLGTTRVNVGWALGAQAVTLLALVMVIFWPVAPVAPPSVATAPAFRTLGDPPAPGPAGAPAGSVHRVKVVFAPTTTEADLRALLLEVRAELVAGPSPLGAYTLALPARGPAAEPLTLVLEHLRADRHIRFAEPEVDGGGG